MEKQSILRSDNLQLMNTSILEDEILHQLLMEKVLIYEMQTPIVILKYGKAELLTIDETKHPELSKLNELINQRIEQIKDFYLR